MGTRSVYQSMMQPFLENIYPSYVAKHGREALTAFDYVRSEKYDGPLSPANGVPDLDDISPRRRAVKWVLSMMMGKDDPRRWGSPIFSEYYNYTRFNVTFVLETVN